jgi:hypothetical protein
MVNTIPGSNVLAVLRDLIPGLLIRSTPFFLLHIKKNFKDFII